MSKAHENHREDIVGRANVEDTPELLAYYDDLKKHEAGALWTVANGESRPTSDLYEQPRTARCPRRSWLDLRRPAGNEPR